MRLIIERVSNRKILGHIGFCSLIVIFAMCIPSAVHAAQTDWTAPVPLSSLPGSSWFPDIEVDTSGTAHVVWASGVPGFDTVMYTNRLLTGEWKTPNDIIAMDNSAGSAATRPTLLFSDNNILHLSFHANNVYYSASPVTTAYAADSWLPPSQMNGDQVGYFSKMAEDSRGTLHMIYTENTPDGSCMQCYHIYYVRSVDDGTTWTEPVDISVLPLGAAKPTIIVDSHDGLHVVWEAGYGGGLGQLSDPSDVYYTSSLDNGVTWSKPYQLNRHHDDMRVMAKNVVIGRGKDDQLIVVWWAIPEDKLYFRLSSDQGQTWSGEQQIPGVWGAWDVYQSRLDTYAAATDSSSNVHFVIVGRRLQEQERLDLLHLTWDGRVWSEPDVISTFQGDVPEWPRAAIALGNELHVVWFVRDQANIFNSDNAQYQIWYSTRQIDSTSIPPLVLPTPAIPPPTATSTNSVTSLWRDTSYNPVVLRAPVVSNLNPPQDYGGILGVANDIKSENDDILIIVLSLFFALIMPATVAISRIWRRVGKFR